MLEINHDMTIKTSSETVYQALTTLNGLRAWFTSKANGCGEINTNWELEFSDQPSFNWHISKLEDRRRVIWKCLLGPGNAVGTEVEFTLTPDAYQQTLLTITHRGWQKEDPKYQSCVEIWRNLMKHLQHYCETGIAQPAYH